MIASEFCSGGGFGDYVAVDFMFFFRFSGPSRPLPPWLEEVLEQSFEVHTGGMWCFGLQFEVLWARATIGLDSFLVFVWGFLPCFVYILQLAC